MIPYTPETGLCLLSFLLPKTLWPLLADDSTHEHPQLICCLFLRWTFHFLLSFSLSSLAAGHVIHNRYLLLFCHLTFASSRNSAAERFHFQPPVCGELAIICSLSALNYNGNSSRSPPLFFTIIFGGWFYLSLSRPRRLSSTFFRDNGFHYIWLLQLELVVRKKKHKGITNSRG